jgi:rhodanese-related sulfurtransferase
MFNLFTGTKNVPTAEVENLREALQHTGENVIVVDCREENEYQGELGHISGSRLIPLGQLANRIDEIAQHKYEPVYVICRSGNRSKKAVFILHQHGFEQSYSVNGGMRRWNELESENVSI